MRPRVEAAAVETAVIHDYLAKIRNVARPQVGLNGGKKARLLNQHDALHGWLI